MSRENEKGDRGRSTFPPLPLPISWWEKYLYVGMVVQGSESHGTLLMLMFHWPLLRILPISECFFLYRIAQQGDFFHCSIPPHRQTKYPTVVQMSPGISPGAMLPPALQLRLSGDRIFMQTWMALVQTNLLLTPRGECDAMMSAFLSLSLSLSWRKGTIALYLRTTAKQNFFILFFPMDDSF